MAFLTQLRTGRSCSLSAQTIVGRSPDCLVALRDTVVSSHHAALRWHGEDWWVRDLGSRNGTWLDGRALGPGEEARVVEGSKLSFGTDGDTWILEDAGPPGPLAIRARDGATVRDSGGVLLLPDDEAPELAVVLGPGGTWVLDDGADSPVEDGAMLTVAGERWRVHLPRAIERTAEARADGVRLVFRVSMDEEYVEIEVHQEQTVTRLRPRSFNYLLLTLARQRLADAELRESTRGWVDQEDLARRLRIEHNTVNVQLYRARQALGKVRDDLATAIVERRNRASQIRFGLDEVAVERI